MKTEAFPRISGVEEASGVARRGDELLCVTDADPGAYYAYAIPKDAGPLLELRPDAMRRLPLGGGREGNGLAIDLESIDVLADGRVVALSERLRSLIDDRGLVIQYDDPVSEVGDRGLEGVAVRSLASATSEVTVLWEGGRIDDGDLQPQLRSLVNPAEPAQRSVFRPFLLTHLLERGASNLKLTLDSDADLIELQVPIPEPDVTDGYRFRAADLVWHRDGFIVLLNSQAVKKRPPKPKWGPRWLQRFDRSGKAIGDPLDLDTEAAKAIGGDGLKDKNWEGLGWYDEDRLVLVHDTPGGDAFPTALILKLPAAWQA